MGIPSMRSMLLRAGLAVIGTLVLPAAPAPSQEAPVQVLLWIRAGALAPEEVESDPDAAPALRRMVLGGLTAAEIVLDPDAAAVALDPSTIAVWSIDAPARARIEAARGRPAMDIDGTGTEPGSLASKERAADGSSWSHPVARLLGGRFGKPPPPSEQEESAIRRIRAALGKKESGAAVRDRPPSIDLPVGPTQNTGTRTGADTAPAPNRDAGKGEPPGAALAQRALALIEDGAPLVIVREPVALEGGAKARDAALGLMAAWVGGRNTVLMVLSARPALTDGKAVPRASLVIYGRGIRAGVVTAKPRSLGALRATVLRILGLEPSAESPGAEEAIDAMER